MVDFTVMEVGGRSVTLAGICFMLAGCCLVAFVVMGIFAAQRGWGEVRSLSSKETADLLHGDPSNIDRGRGVFSYGPHKGVGFSVSCTRELLDAAWSERDYVKFFCLWLVPTLLNCTFLLLFGGIALQLTPLAAGLLFACASLFPGIMLIQLTTWVLEVILTSPAR